MKTNFGLRLFLIGAIFLSAADISGICAEISERAATIERSERSADVGALTKVKDKKRLPKLLEGKRRPKTFLEKFDFSYLLMQGYDRNALHNSLHKGSWFNEHEFVAGFTDRPSENFVYHIDYQLQYDFYYEFGSQTVFKNSVNARSAYKVSPTLFIETDYDFDIFRRPHSASAGYDGHQIKIGPKHYLIPRKLYQKPFYSFSYREYPKFKARDSSENETTADRKDLAHRLGYEIGFFVTPSILLRLRNQIGRNDSNDQLRDFYDYDFYQVTPTLTWRFDKKTTLAGGVQYQRNNYDQRDFSGSADRENVYSAFANFHRALNKSVDWVVSCTYVKYDGNIPQLNFQNSLISTGFQIDF